MDDVIEIPVSLLAVIITGMFTFGGVAVRVLGTLGSNNVTAAATVTDSAVDMLEMLDHRIKQVEETNTDLRGRIRSLENNALMQTKFWHEGFETLSAQIARLGESPEWTPYLIAKDS